MISVDIDQLYVWMNAFLWPFFRILALVGTAPLLSDSAIPIRVKVGLSVLLTVAIAPALGPLPQIPTASYAGLWIGLQQVIIGIALGLVMRIVFGAVQAAGELIGLHMGLAFASFFDPATGANTAVLARIINTVTMLLFLSLNGHLMLLWGVIRSFDVLPIQVGSLDPNGWGVLLEWSSELMVSGMLLALPLVIVLLTINLSLGILNRTAQQLSVFVVGFPISLMTGLTLLSIVLPQSAPFLANFFERGYSTMARLAQALAGP
jgi:flagellar biosynthetic protein FliR